MNYQKKYLSIFMLILITKPLTMTSTVQLMIILKICDRKRKEELSIENSFLPS